MQEKITVKEAIKKGWLTINVPVFIIMIGSIGLFTYLNKQKIITDGVAGIADIVGFLSAWLCWSYQEPKWKVWAFDKVDNVFELEAEAIAANLMWRDGSFWNKTEIWSKADKAKWIELQRRFDIPEEDDDVKKGER